MLNPNEKLEHYLALAGSVSGAGAADLCIRATADPNLHVFGELLNLPNIVALAADPATAPHHALLRLFAFGTYGSYASNPALYPPLSERHLTKLRALSLVSLTAGHTSLPYETALAELALPTPQALEQFILDSVHPSLLSVRIDQRAQTLLITATAPRDVDTAPDASHIGSLITTLTAWKESCDALLGAIDSKIEFVGSETVRKKALSDSRESNQRRVREAVRAAETGLGGRGGALTGGGGGAVGTDHGVFEFIGEQDRFGAHRDRRMRSTRTRMP